MLPPARSSHSKDQVVGSFDNVSLNRLTSTTRARNSGHAYARFIIFRTNGFLAEGRQQTMEDDWNVLFLVFSSFVAVITVCVALIAVKILGAHAARRRALKRRLPDMGHP